MSRREVSPLTNHILNVIVLPVSDGAEAKFGERSQVQEVQDPAKVPSMAGLPTVMDIKVVSR